MDIEVILDNLTKRITNLISNLGLIATILFGILSIANSYLGLNFLFIILIFFILIGFMVNILYSLILYFQLSLYIENKIFDLSSFEELRSKSYKFIKHFNKLLNSDLNNFLTELSESFNEFAIKENEIFTKEVQRSNLPLNDKNIIKYNDVQEFSIILTSITNFIVSLRIFLEDDGKLLLDSDQGQKIRLVYNYENNNIIIDRLNEINGLIENFLKEIVKYQKIEFIDTYLAPYFDGSYVIVTISDFIADYEILLGDNYNFLIEDCFKIRKKYEKHIKMNYFLFSSLILSIFLSVILILFNSL